MTKTVLTAEQWKLAESPDPVVLEVRNLTKRFPVGGLFRSKQVHALTDVSFAIRRGEVLAVVGESGSGKSTAARLIARLMEPTSGEIIFRGQNVLQTEKRGASLSYRSGVQMIFQDPFGSMNPTHSVAHHIMRPLQIHHKVERRSDLLPRVHELLATVGLNPPADIANKYPHELSGGQRQRVRSPAPWPLIRKSCWPTNQFRCSMFRFGLAF